MPNLASTHYVGMRLSDPRLVLGQTACRLRAKRLSLAMGCDRNNRFDLNPAPTLKPSA